MYLKVGKMKLSSKNLSPGKWQNYLLLPSRTSGTCPTGFRISRATLSVSNVCIVPKFRFTMGSLTTVASCLNESGTLCCKISGRTSATSSVAFCIFKEVSTVGSNGNLSRKREAAKSLSWFKGNYINECPFKKFITNIPV